MKKILVVLASAFVLFLGGCTSNIYEPDVYIPEMESEVIEELPLDEIPEFDIRTTEDFLNALIELGFSYSLIDWRYSLIPITDETIMTSFSIYQNGENFGSFDMYEFAIQEDFDYFIRRIGDDGVTFGYPRRNWRSWSEGYWFKNGLMIFQPHFSWSDVDNPDLATLIGEQFTQPDPTIVWGEVPSNPYFNPEDTWFDMTVLELFLSQFKTFWWNTRGWKDLETGNVYVWSDDGNLELAEEFPPLIFGLYRHFWGEGAEDFSLSSDGSIFNHLGEPIGDTPFIFRDNDRSPLPSIASHFMLYELIPDSMPFIVIRTGHWSSSSFAFPGVSRLFAYVNGEFQYVQKLGTVPSFWNDEDGNLFVSYFDHYHGEYGLYQLIITENGVSKELIDDFTEPNVDMHTQAMLALETLFRIPRLTGLTEYLENRLR